MTPEGLAALHGAAFVDPRPWTATEFAAQLALPGTLLVAEAEGFALLRVLAGEAEVLTLAVAPAARRRGLGRRLLARALAGAAAEGATAAVLEVAEANGAARALYAQAGFAEAGRRPGYFRGGDALILRKHLTGQ